VKPVDARQVAAAAVVEMMRARDPVAVETDGQSQSLDAIAATLEKQRARAERALHPTIDLSRPLSVGQWATAGVLDAVPKGITWLEKKLHGAWVRTKHGLESLYGSISRGAVSAWQAVTGTVVESDAAQTPVAAAQAVTSGPAESAGARVSAVADPKPNHTMEGAKRVGRKIVNGARDLLMSEPEKATETHTVEVTFRDGSSEHFHVAVNDLATSIWLRRMSTAAIAVACFPITPGSGGVSCTSAALASAGLGAYFRATGDKMSSRACFGTAGKQGAIGAVIGVPVVGAWAVAGSGAAGATAVLMAPAVDVAMGACTVNEATRTGRMIEGAPVAVIVGLGQVSVTPEGNELFADQLPPAEGMPWAESPDPNGEPEPEPTLA
jgi:hypothetical protein